MPKTPPKLPTVAEAQATLDAARATYEAASKALHDAGRSLREARERAAKDAEREARNRTAAARRKAQKLASSLGVEIERHTDLDSRPWFVSHPALEDAADPFNGDHYVHDWESVLYRVEGYAKALAERVAK